MFFILIRTASDRISKVFRGFQAFGYTRVCGCRRFLEKLSGPFGLQEILDVTPLEVSLSMPSSLRWRVVAAFEHAKA